MPRRSGKPQGPPLWGARDACGSAEYAKCRQHDPLLLGRMLRRKVEERVQRSATQQAPMPTHLTWRKDLRLWLEFSCQKGGRGREGERERGREGERERGREGERERERGRQRERDREREREKERERVRK